MSTKLPSIGELIEANPGLDVGGYGLNLFLKAPPTESFLKYEAKHKRRMAQPHAVLTSMHRSDIGGLWQIAEFLNHPSPKVQGRARMVLFEIATRARALAEAGDTLESVIESTKNRMRELM